MNIDIDTSYEMKLLTPLKGTLGVKISDYLFSLKNNGISITDIFATLSTLLAAVILANYI